MVVAVVLLEENVRRLDVAVDQPAVVGFVQCAGDLGHDRGGPGGIEAASARDELAQVLTVDVAHREVESAVVLPGLVHGDDMRVVERSGDSRLALEARAEARVLGELGGNQLERDVAVELLLAGEVDDTHAAAADQALDRAAGDLHALAGLVDDLHLAVDSFHLKWPRTTE